MALRHPGNARYSASSRLSPAAFREFMLSQDFTEIHTPKITGIGAEGGAEVFELDYFGMPATLAQSPQMYKQTCVAFFDRVFEVGAVYRAELAQHQPPSERIQQAWTLRWDTSTAWRT